MRNLMQPNPSTLSGRFAHFPKPPTSSSVSMLSASRPGNDASVVGIVLVLTVFSVLLVCGVFPYRSLHSGGVFCTLAMCPLPAAFLFGHRTPLMDHIP